MLKTKKLLAFMGVLVLVFGTVGTLWALNASYNRPVPLMDYVPQELGIYDTMYPELAENDCRSCHGNSLADRHHLTETVVRDRLCTPCHDLIPEPPGVIVYRSCTASAGSYGCHNWVTDLGNGWHHNIDLSGSENCTCCHDPNLIAPISAFRSLEQYPPSLVTPTPFSCENCHWDQAVSTSGGVEHPCTYDHYNIWGDFVGYYEYGVEIKSNFDTHHMGFKGNVASQCAKCHSMDPNDASWDPYNPELIRYCMICHDVGTLHTIQPHVADVPGWDAVGFHDPDAGPDPTSYRTFTANEQCFGCHADLIPDPPLVDPCVGYVPTIDAGVYGIEPNSGACYTYVTLRGINFGEEQYDDSFVQMRLTGVGNPWVNVPVYSWTETQIEFEIPCWTFVKGNYKVRVQTNCGNSNNRLFSLKDWGTVMSINAQAGPCSQWITVTGSGFTTSRLTAPDASGYGIARFVDFVASQGTYTAVTYGGTWTDTSFKVRFFNFYEDGIDPITGQRNFVQDDGSGACPDEPTIWKCSGPPDLWLGSYQMFFYTVYYHDDDPLVNPGLSCGDTIHQVTISDPVIFELTAQPVIFRLNPTKIDKYTRLKIFGQNFGPYQTDGEVRIGGKNQAKNPALLQGKLLGKVKAWSNTMVKVRLTKGTKGTTKYIWIEKDGMKSNRGLGLLGNGQKLMKLEINP